MNPCAPRTVTSLRLVVFNVDILCFRWTDYRSLRLGGELETPRDRRPMVQQERARVTREKIVLGGRRRSSDGLATLTRPLVTSVRPPV